MRLGLLITSGSKCTSYIAYFKKIANPLPLSRKLSNMESADEKPPIGAILVNIPGKTSHTVNMEDIFIDGSSLYAEGEKMETSFDNHTHAKSPSHLFNESSIRNEGETSVTGCGNKMKIEIRDVKSRVVNSQIECSALSLIADESSQLDKGKVKQSVLPKYLLDSVSNLIRQENTKHKDAADCKSETVSSNTAEKCEVNISNQFCENTHIKTEDHNDLLDLDVEGIPEAVSDIKDLTERDNKLFLDDNKSEADKCCVDAGDSAAIVSNDGDVLMESITKVDQHERSEAEMELLFPDLIDETMSSTVPEEDVIDISSLFTGELDRHRKRGKKRSGKWKRVKNKIKKHNKDDKDIEEKNDTDVGRKLPPNYFVSIQITNKKIHEALSKVQEEVLKGNQLLSSAMIKLDKLHLTLMVLRIDSEEDMARAKKALDNTMEKLLPTYYNKTLTFDLCGLENFRNEIVFAMIKDQIQTEEIKKIASMVEYSFFANDLLSTEDHGFKPHVTVMKLSKGKRLRKQGIKKIDSSLYEKYKSTEFGEETVTKLQLCSMMKTGPTGYYLVEHEVHFPSERSGDDSGFTENSFADKDSLNGTASTHGDKYCPDKINQSQNSYVKEENSNESCEMMDTANDVPKFATKSERDIDCENECQAMDTVNRSGSSKST